MRVRLPQTTTRAGASVLVRALDSMTWTEGGPRFSGPALRRTQAHELEALGKRPALVEYTEVEDVERDCRGRRRWRTLLVLWRWDGAWIELARARGDCHDSLRALGEAAAEITGETDYALRSAQALKRIWIVVQQQLAELDGEWRWKTLLALRDQARVKALRLQPAPTPNPAVVWEGGTPVGILLPRPQTRAIASGTAAQGAPGEWWLNRRWQRR